MKKWNFAYIPEISNEKLMNYFENNLNLNSDQIEALSIGVTVILFNVFEMFLVLFLSYFLGVLKESILFCIMFIPLRMFAAGIHCKSGHACIITTLIFYLGSSLLSKYCPLQNTLIFFISTVCIILLLKYAPADTENRPILGKECRNKLKIKTISVAILILFINITLGNNTTLNCSMYALIIEAISVMPLTYKLFGASYNNYKLYE